MIFSGKGLKIMNLGDGKNANGESHAIDEDDDDAVDPHLARIKSAAGGEESDEEVQEIHGIIFSPGKLVLTGVALMAAGRGFRRREGRRRISDGRFGRGGVRRQRQRRRKRGEGFGFFFISPPPPSSPVLRRDGDHPDGNLRREI